MVSKREKTRGDAAAHPKKRENIFLRLNQRMLLIGQTVIMEIARNADQIRTGFFQDDLDLAKRMIMQV